MKVDVTFLTIRLNKNIIHAEAIQDYYTPVQIHLNTDSLDDVTISELISNGWDNTFSINSLYSGENEAKDICKKFTNIEINTEIREVYIF